MYVKLWLTRLVSNVLTDYACFTMRLIWSENLERMFETSTWQTMYECFAFPIRKVNMYLEAIFSHDFGSDRGSRGCRGAQGVAGGRERRRLLQGGRGCDSHTDSPRPLHDLLLLLIALVPRSCKRSCHVWHRHHHLLASLVRRAWLKSATNKKVSFKRCNVQFTNL